MKLITFLPLAIPLGAALLLLCGRTHRLWQKGVSLLASLSLLLVSVILIKQVHQQGILVFHFGNWPPPFGILLAVDTLGAIMIAISSVVGLTSVLYAFSDIGEERMKGSFYSLFYFLLFGVNGSFLTGDFFNLFVFFEVMLMSSYVLLVLGNEKAQAKYGFTYLMLNLTGSTLFLVGAGILYGLLGTLNMAQIANQIGSVPNTGLILVVALIFFFVFGLKSAIFPLYNWLPDSYSAPPTPVSAVFAGLLTKVGVYSLYRAFGTIFTFDIAFTHHTLLLTLAGLTMLFGVWGAVVQYDVRYILSFHSISQMGYILMGLAIFSPLALAGGIFHMIHHSLIKSSLFLIGGGMGSLGKTQDLKKLGGLATATSLLALFFMISSMALSGIPPLSGFFSKFTLILSAFNNHHPWLVTAALVTSLFTLYSMIKIWRLGFWGEKPPHQTYDSTHFSWKQKGPLLLTCGLSVLFVLSLTIFANPIMTLSKKAGQQLMNREAYIQAVLNSRPVPQRGRP